ncbi:Aste57867_1736 [Aphanomyces stellatus]|uniref:Aste57867_1736 protein n=1 Tax=Aphanomyces stellatus TaxID=120398 RepID=A0A485KB29_9STRA|nr:hypothetical protein As57867_001734 [Aphanomyces stellatus]VFT78946.1 Aste57867_1736 [Aphanomyces stellatus]
MHVVAAVVLSFVASQAVVAQPASFCPYATLPDNVVNILDASYCPVASVRCIVTKRCQVNTSGTFQAVGSLRATNETELLLDGKGGRLDLSMLDLPDTMIQVYVTFRNVTEFRLPGRMKWPSTLTSLSIQNCRLDSMPTNLPPTLTNLNVSGNALQSSAELRNLRLLCPALKSLDISRNAYTELVDVDWRQYTRIGLGFNPNLTTIQRVLFNPAIQSLNVRSVAIANWLMDNSTFKALHTALKPNGTMSNSSEATAKTVVGHYNSLTTITTNPTACTASQGQIQELWPDKPNRDTSTTTFQVCVLPDDEFGVNASSGWGVKCFLGFSGGAVAVLSLLIFGIVHRRRQLRAKRDLAIAQKHYTHSQTPTLTWTEEEGLDMKVLSLVRLDERELTLERKVGSGAFADVWLARFQGESVAVKKLHHINVSLPQLQSFVAEIQLLSSFDSPYIVKLIGAAWTRPSDVKCVMELMDGGDLKDYLDKHRPQELTWSDKYHHIYCIVEGLVYLHSLNIIHRDLKSRNVLLDSTKGTKLTDFGISKEDMQSTMTMGVGTFRWMAPEVVQDHDYTVAADIYSFGMLLSEFDTHHIPYEDLKNPTNGNPISDTAIIVKVVGGTLKPTFTNECPPWVLEMANQCLALNPKDRPTAMQLAHSMRSKLKDLVQPIVA